MLVGSIVVPGTGKIYIASIRITNRMTNEIADCKICDTDEYILKQVIEYIHQTNTTTYYV